MLPVQGLWTYSLPVDSRGPVAGSRRAPSLLASLTTANRVPGKMSAGTARPQMRGPWAAASSSAIRPSRPMRPELSETFLARLKQLARRHDWPWNYAPLHQHLRQARALGRLKIAAAGSDIEPEGPFVAISDLSGSTAAAEERPGERTPIR